MSLIQLKKKEDCMFDMISLGEVMLRLDPGEMRVRNARQFTVWEGGGEYNVARGLRRCFGMKTAVVTALAFAMIDNAELLRWDGTINLQPLLRPVAIVIFSITAAVFGSVWLVRRLYATRTFDTIALRQEMKASEGFTGVVSGLEHFIGDELEVFADLKPSGKVKGTDGRVYEAILAFGGYAEKGSLVKVLRTEQGRLYCEKV